jgi:hypothetical protein
MIEEALDVRLHHVAVRAEPQRPIQLFHRRVDGHAPPIAKATGQKIRLVDGFQQARHRILHQLVLGGRYPQRPQLAFAFGNVAPTHTRRSVSALAQPPNQRADVLRQPLAVLPRRHPIHPAGRSLVERRPTGGEHTLVQMAVQRREPMLLLSFGFACYRPQEG